jgi:serine/threonine-protein kinase
VPFEGPVAARIPLAAVPVLRKALAKNRADRFATAAEMAEALREAAAKIGLRISRAPVAHWVSSSFATELEARRNAIRTAMHRSRPPSADESLPALPALVGPPSLPSITSQSGSIPAVTSTPPPSLTSVAATRSVHPGAEDVTQTDFRPKRALLWAGGGAAMLLLLLTIWIASRPSGEETLPAASSAPPAPVAPAALNETAEPTPAPPATNEPTEPVAPAAVATKDRPKSWRDVPQRPRPSAKAPTAKSEPVAEKSDPKPPPATTASAKPASTSTSTGVKIEKNPYLRQE